MPTRPGRARTERHDAEQRDAEKEARGQHVAVEALVDALGHAQLAHGARAVAHGEVARVQRLGLVNERREAVEALVADAVLPAGKA